MKTIGVIGGMGPAATLDFLGKIIDTTPARKDQDHIPVIMVNRPQIPDRTHFLLGRGDSPLPLLLESSHQLVDGGALALCMPCNTAHYFEDDIREAVSVPFISIVDSALREIKQQYPRVTRVGLMATQGTLTGDVYHRVFETAGLSIVSMDNRFQATMMDIIYRVKGNQLQSAVPSFQRQVHSLEQQGAEVIIAACTEIPLLLPFVKTTVPMIDPTLLLAKNMVSFALQSTQ
jgi:aspartate racemase